MPFNMFFPGNSNRSAINANGNAIPNVINVEQIANCQQNYWKSTVEHNINSAKEILDIASKSSIEVLEVMGKNFTEKMNKPFAAKTKHN